MYISLKRYFKGFDSQDCKLEVTSTAFGSFSVHVPYYYVYLVKTSKSRTNTSHGSPTFDNLRSQKLWVFNQKLERSH